MRLKNARLLLFWCLLFILMMQPGLRRYFYVLGFIILVIMSIYVYTVARAGIDYGYIKTNIPPSTLTYTCIGLRGPLGDFKHDGDLSSSTFTTNPLPALGDSATQEFTPSTDQPVREWHNVHMLINANDAADVDGSAGLV